MLPPHIVQCIALVMLLMRHAVAISCKRELDKAVQALGFKQTKT
jgi:uncharacterized membrane protein affecting hemolysin expression